MINNLKEKSTEIASNPVNIFITFIGLIVSGGGIFGVNHLADNFWEPAKVKFENIDKGQKDAIREAKGVSLRLDVLINIMCSDSEEGVNKDCVEDNWEDVMSERKAIRARSGFGRRER